MKLSLFLIIVTTIVIVTYPKIFSQAREIDGKLVATGDSLTISYKFEGNLNQEYEIKLFVQSLGNYFSEFEPKENYLHGDIGRILLKDNSEKKIIWEYKKEIRGGLDEDDLEFKITYEEAGSSTWYYYVGAAVFGAVVGFLISDSSDCTDCPESFANPPTRP